ncbi:MAG: NAD(P)-dependent oxidoreductase [Deltaproteobacteria bacterium]|nr:NAD(P)-dependent oxidoreductase [Deltaproteobacteria bacterium]MBW2421189.1 NAD(P)-dependent oxidoreductase [Deltaproteobacteria bacterium]
MRVAFLCLGAMGYPMAGHLARAGHEIAVYNRSPSKRDAWLAAHPVSRSAASPAEAARGADFVMACTGNDDDLREITLGPGGAFEAMAPGSCFVDHTTVSATLARELAGEASRRGFGFLDAPVSGGQAGAEAGALTIMVGGEAEAYERAAPLLGCYAKKQLRMGPAGSGQLTKMVNQICIAGLVQGLAEGLQFARSSGLDAGRAVEVISQGAAQSWQLDNRALSMLEGRFDFGFAVDWMRKDLGIALDEASRCGARLPITALVDELYAEVQARGGGRLDTSSLMTLLE